MTTAEIIPATASEARDLTDRIKLAVDGTWHLIKQAYLSRAWDALGYDSWDDYCTREFGTSRLRLPREERQEVVASLREIGMSTRAIAAATGTNRETVRQELSGGNFLSPESAPTPIRSIQGEAMADDEFYEEDEPVEQVHRAFQQGTKGSTAPPPRVTGTDGKSYAAQPTRTPNRPQLPGQFLAAANDLTKVIGRVEKLRTDDRYRSNRGAIADQCVPSVRRAIEILSDLMNDLGQDHYTSPEGN